MASSGITLAAAESCTGGLICHKISSLPGSSRFFIGGLVAYDNDVKTNMLGVSHEIISSKGAVSEECAQAMASGVRKLLKAEVGIATTGIAGPDGGTHALPVGVVYLAICSSKEQVVKKHHFKGDREQVVTSAAQKMLELLCHHY